MAKSTEEKPSQFEFKAEIQQLLHILIHSIYTSKDIFVRELISNAADALEKVRFRQVGGLETVDSDAALEIRLETKKGDGKVLTIRDSGIGMTEEEARTNIGTIAHSGASAFLAKLKEDEKKGLSLIGKFGVGFYSVFMAAEKVVLTSRAADPAAAPVVWSSDGLGTYTLETTEEEVPRGTKIEVHLKESEERFAEVDTLKAAIREYSSFVPFPIFVDGEQVNRTTALWREQPSQVKEESYNEFFKYLTHDTQEPRLKLHLSVDAPLQFSTLLFVPQTNTEIAGFGQGEVSVQLYVKRVLIDGKNKDLLPKYLRFVQGVVESEDLPLNISRETLQENALVFKIRETITRKLLDLLLNLAQNKAQEYGQLWKTFGPILKEGHTDYSNRERFQELLRFNSSKEDEDGLVSLKEYVERMPEGQKAIYYLSGASREALERDARLELLRKKDVEVLYLSDMADEFVLGSIGAYDSKTLLSADQVKPEDLRDLAARSEGEDAAKKKDDAADDSPVEMRPLINRFKEILGERVLDVRKSERLVDSPACLVGDEHQASAHIEKVMRMINKGSDLPRRVLEINTEHKLVRNLARLLERDPKDAFVERACEQLFEGALLVDGYLTDPHKLVERMGALLEEAATLKAEKAV